MSAWMRLYRHLKDAGVDVYAPGYHQGECTSPYVVLKDEGLSPYYEYSSNQHVYTLLCYVPKMSYSQLEPFVDQVESLVDELYPMFHSSHYRTASYYDDDVKGHMISTQYINYRKNTR